MLPTPKQKEEKTIANKKSLFTSHEKRFKELAQSIEKNPKLLHDPLIRVRLMLSMAIINSSYGLIKSKDEPEIITNARYHDFSIVSSFLTFSIFLSFVANKVLKFKRFWWFSIPIGFGTTYFLLYPIMIQISPHLKRIQVISESYIPLNNSSKSLSFIEISLKKTSKH